MKTDLDHLPANKQRELERVKAIVFEEFEDAIALGTMGWKKKGRIEVLGLEVRTSARRYLDHGVLRTAWVHLVALAGWRLGIDRGRVAAWCGR